MRTKEEKKTAPILMGVTQIMLAEQRCGGEGGGQDVCEQLRKRLCFWLQNKSNAREQWCLGRVCVSGCGGHEFELFSKHNLRDAHHCTPQKDTQVHW